MKIKAIIGRNGGIDDSDLDEIEGIFGNNSEGWNILSPQYRTNSSNVRDATPDSNGRNACVTSMPCEENARFNDPQGFYRELSSRGYIVRDSKVA